MLFLTSIDVYTDIFPPTGNDQMLEVVRLLIIDEMNWLQESCGPALETIVTRTTRRVGIFYAFVHKIFVSENVKV